MPGEYARVTALSFLPQLTALNDSPLDYLILTAGLLLNHL